MFSLEASAMSMETLPWIHDRHDAIHADPIRNGGSRTIIQDVILQREFAEGEEEGLAPARVVVRREVEDNGDEAANILDADGRVLEILIAGIGLGCVAGIISRGVVVA